MKHTLDSPPYDPVYTPPAEDRFVFTSNFENAVIPLQATSCWCVLCDATTCTCAQAVASSGTREQYSVNRFCSRGESVQVRGFRKLLFSQFKPKCRLGLFEKPVLIMCWNQTQNISRNIFNFPGILMDKTHQFSQMFSLGCCEKSHFIELCFIVKSRLMSKFNFTDYIIEKNRILLSHFTSMLSSNFLIATD